MPRAEPDAPITIAASPETHQQVCAHPDDPRRWREAPLAQRVFIVHNQIMRVSDRLVAGMGLTSSRWLLLGALERYETPPSLSELSQNGLLTLQNVSRMVAAMEAEGLVERFSTPGKGRSVFVRMTGRGRDLLEKAAGAARRFAAGFLHGLGEEEVNQCEGLLEHLIGNLERFEKKLCEESASCSAK